MASPALLRSLRCLLLALFAFVLPAFAAGPPLQWIKLPVPPFPGGSTVVNSITTDSQGNLFLGAGPKTGLLKLNSSGDLQWGWGLANTGNNPYVWGQTVIVDNTGNLTVVGDSYGPLTLGLLTNNQNSSSKFFGKFTPQGTNTIAKSFSNLIAGVPSTVAIPSGGFFVGGWFANAVSYEGITLSPTADSDIAVFKLSADGSPIWARRLAGTSEETFGGIASTAEGDVVVSGWSVSPTIAGGGVTAQGRGSRTVFLFSLDKDGVGKWAKSVPAALINYISFPNAVTYSASDNHIYWAGDFVGSLGISSPSLSSSDTDIFLAKISTDGLVEWTRQIGGSGNQFAQAVKADAAGNIYVGGTFTTELRIGSTTLQTKGGQDLFLAKYKNDGTFLWVKQIGGAGNDSEICLEFGQNGELFVGGTISGGLLLEGQYVEGPGTSDGFLAKFAAEGEPPKFILQPQSQVASAGITVTLASDVAPNSAAPSFQWWFNGATLLNKTNASLSIQNFQSSYAGNYFVTATNPSGQAQSEFASISFTDASTLELSVHPSLRIYGTIGKTYRIEASEAVAATPTWTIAGTVTLTVSPQIWIDNNAALNEKRVYRVILQ